MRNKICNQPINPILELQVSKKYVDKKISTEIHEKATPFINWLKEAEEDDSEEEEEEDQVEVRAITLNGIGHRICNELIFVEFCLQAKNNTFQKHCF
jgi:hypothetical protein